MLGDNASNRLSGNSLVYNWEDVSTPQAPPNPSLPPFTSRTPTEPRKDYADALFDNGITAFLAGRYPDASYRFQRAAKEYHDRPDLEKEANSLYHLGATCCFLKQYYEARLHLTTAKTIYEEIGPRCRQEQLRCDRHLVRVEEDSGNTQAALDAYQELICVSQEERLPIQEAWCIYHLGHLFNQTRRYEEAFHLLKDATEMAQRVQIWRSRHLRQKIWEISPNDKAILNSRWSATTSRLICLRPAAAGSGWRMRTG